MSHVVICRGVPASGKSTFAQQWVTAEPRRARINRDDIRKSVFGVEFGCDERLVTYIQDAMISMAVARNCDVIIDNTNLNETHLATLVAKLEAFGASYEIKDFPITLAEALNRNARRERKVPASVIIDMHARYQAIT